MYSGVKYDYWEVLPDVLGQASPVHCTLPVEPEVLLPVAPASPLVLCAVPEEVPVAVPVPVFTPLFAELVPEVLILLLSTPFGATFCLASGATWPALAAAFAEPVSLPPVDEPESAASAAPLARVRVAVRKSEVSLFSFIVMLLFWSLLLDNFFQQCTVKKLISACVAVE
ncbi:hypothetical protein ESA_02593 [Cronobacter sakazakii ATCC BAA-894]|uniref:Uncharacterized protein n=1 Tax=Cronobacter sakazakii (strain ATCC BAA-894) TaxID=290339 RepID=A7MIY0_CROS8|nr:hypothetical protein ESA_02593 [Cronobacter sakazakii ATCC BAA-894]